MIIIVAVITIFIIILCDHMCFEVFLSNDL